MKKSMLLGALLALLALVVAAVLGTSRSATAGHGTTDQTDGTCTGCSIG